MWTTRNIIVRTLIWLAAITVPVQSLPAASCGCESGQSCCNSDHSEQCCCSADKVREGRCCCAQAKDKPSRSCCSQTKSHKEPRCTCGPGCKCGNNTLPRPATPPPENNATQKMTSNSVTTVAQAMVCESQATQRHYDAGFDANSAAAHQLCVSLCRFTL